MVACHQYLTNVMDSELKDPEHEYALNWEAIEAVEMDQVSIMVMDSMHAVAGLYAWFT